jgi:recombination protein RecA
LGKKSEELLKEMQDKFDELFSDKKRKVDVISTGSISLDVALGIQGIPLGKFTTIHGKDSTGKSTLSLSIIKNYIADPRFKDKLVLYLDVERAVDFNYAIKIVGEEFSKRVVVYRTNTAESYFIHAEEAMRSEEFGLVILDSIAAMSPKKEMDNDFSDDTMGLIPRMITKFIRRNLEVIDDGNIGFIFINQVRANLKNPYLVYDMPGGWQLRHASSVIIFLSNDARLKVGEREVGIDIKFVVKKNKLAIPNIAGKFPLVYGEGIDSLWDMVRFAEFVGIIKKRGAWYVLDDDKWQGVNGVISGLLENPGLLDKVKNLCYSINTSELEIDETEDNNE